MPISLGGVMLIRRGRARMHIMPDFSATPLADESQVNQWLRFFEFDAPMFCACVLHSMDPADLGLRLEHTHGYSVENETGGHFHQDVSPAVIEYEAYFRPINRIVRESHKK